MQISSSLEVLHTLGCTLVCRNSVKLNFVKTGLKFEFWVNPQSFSHELCLYITRFVAYTVARMHRRTRPRVRCSSASRLLNFTDVSTWFQCLQMAPDSISEREIRKFSWGSMPPDPPSGAYFACSPRPPQLLTCSAAPEWLSVLLVPGQYLPGYATESF